jgi:archaellum component FlaG (FlaF/FlaG flagellin family)
MREKYVLILLALVTMLILGSGVILVGGTSTASSVSTSTNAKATASTKEFDWGNIPYAGGLATKSFVIKNTGSDILKLTNIKTSCHCTKANVTIDGKDSPYFGMSGFSSWIGEIQPGKEATLNVVFDPAFHGPQGIGPVQRYISIETNDASQKKIVFTLTGNVTK